jgi:predicted transcriptional regulator
MPTRYTISNERRDMSSSTMQFKIDNATREKLVNFAAAHNKPADVIFRDAITEYVDREQRREKLRQEVLAIWDDYQRTGLHVTGEEADAWLAKLENGERVPPPQCHT